MTLRIITHTATSLLFVLLDEIIRANVLEVLLLSPISYAMPWLTHSPVLSVFWWNQVRIITLQENKDIAVVSSLRWRTRRFV